MSNSKSNSTPSVSTSNADGAPKTASLSEKSTYQDSELYTQTAMDVNFDNPGKRGIRVKTRTATIAKCPYEKKTVDTTETHIASSEVDQNS